MWIWFGWSNKIHIVGNRRGVRLGASAVYLRDRSRRRTTVGQETETPARRIQDGVALTGARGRRHEPPLRQPYLHRYLAPSSLSERCCKGLLPNVNVVPIFSLA